MTKIDTHMYIHYLAHTQHTTLYLLLPDISDQSHINVDHGHQTIIRGGQSLLPAREKKHGQRQWMMELDQTSPFKRLTESQYLLSKAGHWEEGGRLRPLSQPGWQKMLLPRCGGASAVLSNDHSRPRLLPTKKRDLNRSADIFPSIFCFVFVDFDLSKKRQKTIGGDFCH